MRYSFVLCLTLIFSGFIGARPQSRVTQQAIEKPLRRNLGIKAPTLGQIAIITLAAELLVLMGSESTQQNLKEQITPLALLKNFITQYTSHATATFFHELGHAVATRLLTNQPTTIHLGNVQHQDPPLLDLGCIKIEGLSPTAGTTSIESALTDKQVAAYMGQQFGKYCKEHQLNAKAMTREQVETMLKELATTPHQTIAEKNRVKEAVILLAGGCTAIASHYLMKFLWIWAQQRIKSNKTSWKTAAAQALAPDQIIIEQLLTMLWPNNLDNNALSDGGKLWRNCLEIDQGIINTASRIAPAVSLATGMVLTKKIKGQQPAAIDLLLLTLLNYQLYGYLHFSLGGD